MYPKPRFNGPPSNRQGKPEKDSNLLYGPHAILEAMGAGKQIDKVIMANGLKGDLAKEVMQKATEAGIPVQTVPPAAIDRLVPNDNHQGMAAYAALIYYTDLEDQLMSLQMSGATPLILMLDRISDVRNFGAMARTAECMGVNAVVIPAEGAARITSEAIKVSSGALHHLPVCRVQNLVDAVLLMQAYGIKVVGLTEKAEDEIYDLKLDKPTCIVMGAEDTGLSNTMLKRADFLATIPMAGKVSSLNVSVAAGMVLSEAVRQRRKKD